MHSLSPTFLQNLMRENILVGDIALGSPVHWNNPALLPATEAIAETAFSESDVAEASARLERFAPFLETVFPETRTFHGIIESPIKRIPHMQQYLSRYWNTPLNGTVLLKMDSHLPVSGSIKARGGFYEVLIHAEQLALEHGLLRTGDDYTTLASDKARAFFANYALAVGSTGNLGLSVGIMAAALGFKTTVHMSADARQWKKDVLRSKGVTVIEYASDYSVAVAAGRKAALADPHCHFVDDESSRNLFLGYAVAGRRLGAQLEALGITVSKEHPLVVYLPCGVGGGPGGVTFGLKLVFGDNVHCYFAEPTQAPAVTLGMVTGLGGKVSGADIGLSGKTIADGLAVSRPSDLVCTTMRHLMNGLFTVPDETLFIMLHAMAEHEGVKLEPSALAGVDGLRLSASGAFGPVVAAPGATHILWATGGSLVPPVEWEKYDERGATLSKEREGQEKRICE